MDMIFIGIVIFQSMKLILLGEIMNSRNWIGTQYEKFGNTHATWRNGKQFLAIFENIYDDLFKAQ